MLRNSLGSKLSIKRRDNYVQKRELRLDFKYFLNDELRQTVLKAFLDIAILASLENNSVNGYEITIIFIKKFGLALSTGIIYSTLYSMERKGLVRATYSRRSRVYELTEHGKNNLQNYRSRLEDINGLIAALMEPTTV